MTDVIVSFAGQRISVQPKSRMVNGTWVMTALQSHPRFAFGTDILIPESDIVSPSVDELIYQLTHPKISTTGETIDMPVEVDGLTDLVKVAAEIKTLASNVAKKFQNSVADLKDSISHAGEVSDQFTKSAAALRGALGIHGNGGPPLDDNK